MRSIAIICKDVENLTIDNDISIERLLPSDAMHKRSLCRRAVRLSVWLSDAFVYCVETSKIFWNFHPPFLYFHTKVTIEHIQGLKLCVFWHKVCSWLCQVCSWLCWNVLCEVKNAMEISDGEWKTTDGRAIVSWNRGKNEQICTVKFQIFLGAMPPDLDTVEGLWRPSSDPEPSAIQRFAPPCLARGRRPLHRPSLCVVDILIYFRPW